MPEDGEWFMEDPKRINVDFDNTLTQGEECYFTDGEEQPNDAMVEWVNDKYKEGHTIIIWTARPWSAAGKTVGKLTEWGVRWHGLKCDKGSSDLYVDDKAIHPSQVQNDD